MDKKPDFLCIGAQKASTSWLWTMLRQHSKIWLPPIKELHYFNHLFSPNDNIWTLSSIRNQIWNEIKWYTRDHSMNLEYIKYLTDLALIDPFTENWYMRWFSHSEILNQVRGEVTPAYCALPIDGIKYVYNFLGKNIKLIYIIRKPYERALSQIKMNLFRKRKSVVTLKEWFIEAKSHYIEQRSNYKLYINNWEGIFSNRNFLYLPYKEIRDKPKIVLRQIENFLCVSECNEYENIDGIVHKNKLQSVPAEIINYVKEINLEQDYFLYNKFGEDFCNKI